jgi:chromosome segregation ATPase
VVSLFAALQARLRRQVANMSAAKSSLEASLTHSAQLAAAVNTGALQMQGQLQRYADRAASLEVALRRAEDAVEAQTAELEECTVRWDVCTACLHKSGWWAVHNRSAVLLRWAFYTCCVHSSES